MTAAEVVAAVGPIASAKTVKTLLTQKCKQSPFRHARWRKVGFNLYWANAADEARRVATLPLDAGSKGAPLTPEN